MDVKDFRKSAMAAAFLVIATAAGLSGAEASVTVTAQETGGNVVFSTGGGTLDITALSFVGNTTSTRGNFHPPQRLFTLGASPGSFVAIDEYEGTTGPSSYGSGGFTIANSGTGDRFGIVFAGKLTVPDGFNSGGSIAPSSATFTAQTFAGLGITPGSYTWSWGAAETSDFVTLNVVPLPAAAVLLLSGLAGLAGYRRMQRRAAT